MAEVLDRIRRWFDIRAGELRSVVTIFSSLLLIVVGHTILETVRDTLFLTHLGAKALPPMYVVAAALTLAAGSVSGALSEKLGAGRALVTSQIASAAATVAFFVLPPSRSVLYALYGFSAVTGALLVPQVWATAGGLFHAAQSRRLFGTIAIAAILGAVLGSSTAALALLAFDVTKLFLLAAVAFAASAAMIAIAPKGSGQGQERGARRAEESETARRRSWITPFREEPILVRIAVVVALGAITTLFVDYAFKSAAVARVPKEHLAAFFARYSAVMNVLAFIVQLAIANRVLARAGVVGTAGVMPSFLFLGSVLSFLSGGALLPVLGTKVVDAALRHSVHRTGTELVYLAVPARARDRAKPLIDGALARTAQALAALFVLLMTSIGLASVTTLALLAAVTAGFWGAATAALRKPYLALFRRSLLGGISASDRTARELDLASVEVLIEALASPRPREVVAAMNALARRDRSGVIPALVLLVDDADVLERALDLFGASKRKDWIRFAERLASDRRERVRRSALRALARSRAPELETSRASSIPPTEDRPWIRGYLATADVALGRAANQEFIVELVARAEGGAEALHGVLTALGDLEGSNDAVSRDLLVEVVRAAGAMEDRETIELTARAAAALSCTQMIPWLIAQLERREGRSVVRVSLGRMGPAAYAAVASALADPRTPRSVRMHLPRTLELFGTQEAADTLLSLLVSDRDGLVRYKALRGLGRLVADGHARVDKRTMRTLARRDLVEHFRLLGLAEALTSEPPPRSKLGRATFGLVARLLDEKAKQSFERVFRVLKILFPDEDIHRVHEAATAGDVAARATAGEFLDALLAPRRRQPDDGVRALLRLLTDDLSRRDRVERAIVLLDVTPPRTQLEAIALLRKDPDAVVSELSAALAQDRPVPLSTPGERRAPAAAEALLSFAGARPAHAHG